MIRGPYAKSNSLTSIHKYYNVINYKFMAFSFEFKLHANAAILDTISLGSHATTLYTFHYYT